MADLKELLAGLAKNARDVTKSLESLGEMKQKAMEAGDPRLLLHLDSYEKAVKKLNVAERERIKLEKDIQGAAQAGKKLSDAELRAMNAKLDKYDQISKAVAENAQAAIKYQAQLTKNAEEYNERLKENFRNHTMLGKAFGAATSGIAKLTGGLTAAGLAYKALNNFTEASELRTKIMIQNFRGIQKESTEMNTGFGVVDDTIKGLDSATGGWLFRLTGVARASAQISTFSEELAHAKGFATRLGVDVGEVGVTMAKFSRIAGTDNAKALRIMTEGAIGVSRALGIDTAEAVDFVQLRMQKFGGSATSALMALNEMKDGVEKTNNAFGSTVLRGDDMVQTLLEISRQSNVYAMDQRSIGTVLRDNITRLQATGESYDNAKMKATAFTEALTGKAPEWMNILSGEKVTSGFQKAFGDGGEDAIKAFEEKYGEGLDKAKPGLSKKVQGILKEMKDGTMDQYAGARLIQELTAQTDVGMQAMNEQILDLGSAGTEVLAKQMGVSRDAAHSMLEQAKAWQKEQKTVNDLVKAPAQSIKDELAVRDKNGKKIKDTISDEEARRIAAMTSEKDKRKEIESYMKIKKDEQNLSDNINRKAEESAANQAKVNDLIGVQAKLKERLAAAKASGDDNQVKAIEGMIKENEANIEQYKSKDQEKAEADKGKYDSLNKVEDINKALLNEFSQYSDTTGKSFKGMLEEMSTSRNMLIGAGLLGAGKFMLGALGGLGRIEMLLAKIAMGGGMGGGGLLGDAADVMGGGGKGGSGGKGGKLAGALGKLGSKGKLGKLAAGALSLGGKGLGGVAKFAGKGLGAAGSLVGMAMDTPAAIASAAGGNYKEAAAKMIPSATGAVGGILGGIGGAALAGAGAVPGAIGGSVLGEKAGQYISDWMMKGSKPADTQDKQEKEKPITISPESTKELANKMGESAKESTTPALDAQRQGAMIKPSDAASIRPNEVQMPDASASSSLFGDSSSSGPGGEFVGGMQPDGSVMMKITNMGDVFSSARNMERKNIRHN